MLGEDAELPSFDVFLDLLADTRRRHLWSCLASAPNEVRSLEELARRIAERESQVGDAEAPESSHIGYELYHVHLPKFDEAGLVEFDADERTVRPRSIPPLEDVVGLKPGVPAAETD